MQLVKRGDVGPAAAEIRATLINLGLLAGSGEAPSAISNPDDIVFDAACELALREFQQSRGLVADGIVGQETWRALVAARYQFGDRLLSYSVSTPMVGDDIRELQERLLEIGYDVGRPDGILGSRTDAAIRMFQKECGLTGDGIVGPATMRSLRRLGRKVVGGRPQMLRESAVVRRSGPRISGKRLVIDPGPSINRTDLTIVDSSSGAVFTEAELCRDIALRLQGRFTAIGGQADLTHGPDIDPTSSDRAEFANRVGADVFISLRLDRHHNPQANGIACYHFGTSNGVTSTLGERLASLVQRELVARTQMTDCRIHAKTWELLRFTRMPAVQVALGYLTSESDRSRLGQAQFRDMIAEGLLVAVQRIFLPSESDVATGSLNLSALRALQLR